MTTATRSEGGPGGPNPDDASWLVLRLDDGSSLWTSAAALRQRGFKPSAVARLVNRKFRLANARKADPAGAGFALIAMVVQAGGNIVRNKGHA